MKILVVEDDKKIASFIVKGLTQAGYTVDHAGDGEQGLKLASTEPYAAAIVDIMLPKRDGLTLISMLRKGKVPLPILILSAKRSVSDRVRGLEVGSDDYLAKPFSFMELLARVNALTRRGAASTESAKLSAGDLVMDLIKREVQRRGKPVELQAREFKLLEYLIRNQGRPVSKVMILENIWGYDFDPQTNVVDVLVCRLRDKIDKPFDGKMIQTIRGVGYVLKA
jgi:two-component system OmpR family response regulator